jgi:hypothetical protein
LIPAVSNFIGFIKTNPTMGVLAYEVAAVNLPKTSLSYLRNSKEGQDTLFNEAVNTAGFFGGFYGLSALYSKWLKKLNLSIVEQALEPLSKGRLAKSVALISFAFTFMLSTPFLRNAYSAWKFKSVDFKSLIEKEKSTPATAQAQEMEARQFIRKNLVIGTSLILGGLAAGAGLFYALAKHPALAFNKQTTQTMFGKIAQFFTLDGRHGDGIGGMKAVAFWGLPAYVGWMAGARDRYEFLETGLKFASFTLSFAGIDALLNGYHLKRFAALKKSAVLNTEIEKAFYNKKTGQFIYENLKQLPELLSRFKGLEAVLGRESALFTGIFALKILTSLVIPFGINAYFTNKRIAHDAKKSSLPEVSRTFTDSSSPEYIPPTWQSQTIPPVHYRNTNGFPQQFLGGGAVYYPSPFVQMSTNLWPTYPVNTPAWFTYS